MDHYKILGNEGSDASGAVSLPVFSKLHDYVCFGFDTPTGSVGSILSTEGSAPCSMLVLPLGFWVLRSASGDSLIAGTLLSRASNH